MKLKFGKIFWGLSFLAFFFIIGSSQTSCSPKSGCPINEEAHAKPDKKGKLSTRGGRSQLFPKDMRKKTKRKS